MMNNELSAAAFHHNSPWALSVDSVKCLSQINNGGEHVYIHVICPEATLILWKGALLRCAVGQLHELPGK